MGRSDAAAAGWPFCCVDSNAQRERSDVRKRPKEAIGDGIPASIREPLICLLLCTQTVSLEQVVVLRKAVSHGDAAHPRLISTTMFGRHLHKISQFLTILSAVVLASENHLAIAADVDFGRDIRPILADSRAQDPRRERPFAPDLLARALGARCIVELGTSFGASTTHSALANVSSSGAVSCAS